VAVKLLRPERRGEPRGIARLQREFRQTQSVAHPNVVRFFDLDCDRGSWFIVMELLSGETLAARLRHAAPAGLSVPEALAAAAAVADALAHAHRRDVIHGDVKPGNIFMTDAGEVRLLDFGVAPGASDLPEPVAGTRAYASPEILGGGPAEAGDDVFSLACIAYEMLTGARLYRRGRADAAVRTKVIPNRPPGLGDPAWQLLLRSLEPCRALRPTMEELARGLRGQARAEVAETAPANSVPAAALPDAPAAGAAPSRRTRGVVGGAIAAGLLLLLGVLIGRLEQGSPPVRAAIPAAKPASTSDAQASPATADIAPEPPPKRLQPVAEQGPAQGATRAAAAAAAGLVTFDLPYMVVSNRAVVAPIPLRHLSSAQRDVRVNWRIIEGSARPGRDYGGPESGVERFVAGNNFRILYVPIVANPAPTRDRTFVVELTGATQGVEIGGAPRIAVTILGDR
jgi:hypothetical protein